MKNTTILSLIKEMLEEKYPKYSHPLLIREIYEWCKLKRDILKKEDIAEKIETFFEKGPVEVDAHIKKLEREYKENLIEECDEEKPSDKNDEEVIERRRSFIVPDITINLEFFEKNDKIKNFLTNAIKKTVISEITNPRQLRELVDIMRPMDAVKGTVLIQEKEINDKMFVIEKGEIAVYKNSKKVHVAGAWQVVGASCLLNNMKRASTVITTQDSKLWYGTMIEFYTITNFDQKLKFHFFKRAVRKKVNRKFFKDMTDEELFNGSCKLTFLVDGDKIKKDYLFVTVHDSEIFNCGKREKVGKGTVLQEGVVAIGEIEGYYVPILKKT